MSEYLRRLRVFAPVPAPDSSSSFGSARETWRAGTRPMMTTHTTHATIPNANIRQLVCGAITHSATLGGMRASSSLLPQSVARRPNASPAAASNPLSRRSCAMMSFRVAPRAVRKASSRLRPKPRASRRFARFAHAMSSTAQHRADQREMEAREMELLIPDRLEKEAGALERLAAAAARRPNRCDSSSIVGCACSSVMPGRRRAMLAGKALSGTVGGGSIQTAYSEPGTCAARSMTPMIGWTRHRC